MIASYQEKFAFTQYIHAITADVGMECHFDLGPTETPYNNGESIHLFKLGATVTKEELMKLRAYIVHEVGHKKYTNFDILKEKPELCLPADQQSLVRDVWNQLEDHRVDYLTVTRDAFDGDKTTLMHLEGLVNDQLLPKYKDSGGKLDFESTVRGAVYALDSKNRNDYLVGSDVASEVLRPILTSDDNKYKKAANKVMKHDKTLQAVREIINPILGSEATYELAKRIVQEAEKEKEDNKEEEENEQDSTADGNDEVTVEASDIKPSLEEEGQHIEIDMPKPEEDSEELTALSGKNEYVILDYARDKSYVGCDINDESIARDMHHQGLDYNRYDKLVSNILDNSNSNRLKSEVRKLLQIRSRSIKEYNKKRGKLSSKDVYRVTMKDAVGFNERVFSNKRDALSLDVSVSILCDFSGSMSGDRLTHAISATKMLSDTLRSLEIKHEVAGFTTAYSSIRGSDGIMHMIFKDFNQLSNKEVLNNMLLGSRYLCCNSDADNVLFAANRLSNQRSKRKVLLVLSDGSPSSRKWGNASKTLKHVVDEVGKSGINVIALGICTDYGEYMYPTWETLDSAEDLEAGILNILRNKIFNL